jgi:prepilin-type N-terminal cleavage/methylation domain-containing protein
MRRSSTTSTRGFTLVELMVSLALGTLVLGLAVQLFSQGVDATWVISQRAEMQQDLRASTDLLLKDISLAGSGPPALAQGIALPTATPNRPLYGYAPSCAAFNNCVGVAGAGIAYPCASNVGACVPTLYGVIPGFALGIIPPGSTTRSDVITVVYQDTVLALNCYTVGFAPPPPTVNPITFTAPPNPPPATCILPPGLTFPQAVDDPVVGLKAGDLVLFSNSTGQALGEVTTATGGGPYAVTMVNGDPLWMNQSGNAGDLSTITAGVGTVANRVYVITYYLWLLPDPTGAGPGTPVLMRQVNGQTPVPVAENVVNFQFTYDTYTAAGTLLNNAGDAGYSTGTSFNLIRKINVLHLTIRSQLAGSRSQLAATRGYQSFDLQTSISARNLSYQNRY